MARLFLSDPKVISGRISIEEPASIHYLRDVLRSRQHDTVIVFDGKGREYICSVETISEKIVLIVREESAAVKREGNVVITCACAIPKNSRMDDIIDKLTQLGVDRIIPLITERTQVKLDKKRRLIKHERWEKIAIAASQQSQRVSLPKIDLVTEFDDFISLTNRFDVKLMPNLVGKTKHLSQLLNSLGKNILVAIGPEGDFSQAEVDTAIKNGFISVSLGDTVLRVETAAVSIVSFLRLVSY